MASNPEADTSAKPLLCPECSDEVELNDDDTIPKFCVECSADLSILSVQTECPTCKTTRKKKKNGEYIKFCGECCYDFIKGVSRPNAATSGKCTTRH